MKKTNVRASIVMGLLLVTGQFTSCDNKLISTIENTATNIENTNIKKTKVEVFRQPVVFITGYHFDGWLHDLSELRRIKVWLKP